MIKQQLILKYQQFILMLTFLTRIPVKYSFEFNTSTFGKAYGFFPIIGAIIGGLLFLTTYVAAYIPLSIYAFLVIIMYLMIVGGIHIDGIGDLCDGIFSARNKSRMLEIMEDSHVGAFGVVGLVLYFLGMYIGIYGVLTYPIGKYCIFVMPIIARSMTVFVTGYCRYAKPNGLGKGMVDSIKPIPATLILLGVYVVLYFISVNILIGAIISTGIIGIMVFRIHKILDGITGDVVGASVEIGQVVFLLSMGIVCFIQ